MAILRTQIKVERKRRDWSHKQLGEMAHVSPRTISNIENGHAPFSNSFKRVAEALGIAVPSHLGGDGETFTVSPRRPVEQQEEDLPIHSGEEQLRILDRAIEMIDDLDPAKVELATLRAIIVRNIALTKRQR